jgi:hypothetical protein
MANLPYIRNNGNAAYRCFMISKAHIAINAFWGVSAYLTHQYRGITAPVLKQYHLLLIGPAPAVILHQYTGKMRLHGFAFGFFRDAYHFYQGSCTPP